MEAELSLGRIGETGLHVGMLPLATQVPILPENHRPALFEFPEPCLQ